MTRIAPVLLAVTFAVVGAVKAARILVDAFDGAVSDLANLT